MGRSVVNPGTAGATGMEELQQQRHPGRRSCAVPAARAPLLALASQKAGSHVAMLLCTFFTISSSATSMKEDGL